MEDLRFSIEGTPVPASRPKVSKWGTYYPKTHMNHQGLLNDALAEMSFGEGWPTPTLIEVRCLFVMPRYKTSNYPTHRADVDNLAKLPLDCMTKSEKFWGDDALIVNLVSLKRFVRDDEEPHTKIRVIPIISEPYDSYVDRIFEA